MHQSTLKVRVTTVEPMLGMTAADTKIVEKYIARKSPDGQIHSDEMDALSRAIEAIKKDKDGGKDSEASPSIVSVFPRGADGKPILWDYQIKGFLKDTLDAMIESGVYTEKDLKKLRLSRYLYKRTVDKMIFVAPRQIPIVTGQEMSFCGRPLRAQTMKGERVALALSEQVQAGAVLEFEFRLFDANLIEAIQWCLDYGEYRGLGQWRNSGVGRFTWEEVSLESTAKKKRTA